VKVPWTWLAEHCDPALEPRQLAERLAMTGTEVERVSAVGPASADGFVIGLVTAAEQHPDADRLLVCTVDTGDSERTIVCGAPNVAAGQTVAVALPGAVMPDGRKLGRAKLRGVESDGMILSEAELQISEESDGILVLDADGPAPAPGSPLTELIPLAEQVLELEVTSNRVDCLGIWGVAREVHAATGQPLGPEPWAQDAEATGDGEASSHASVTVEVPDLCPRFTARVFENVKIAPSPPWMKARLMAAGQRPISNIVDITNYVMLLTAQPLHAFDLDRVPGGELTVRTAFEGEKMTTLDGVERVLDYETTLVCDRNGPSGIAGIMGGQVSEVSGETTRVLLEVANWKGTNILRTSRLLALRSDASTRFEKQLHPDLCIRAQRIASRLMVELCGARLVPGTIDVYPDPPAQRALTLRDSKVSGLLGMDIAPSDQADYLQRLGFEAETVGGGLEVSVPPDRHFDVTREVDLIEEVARVHGLDENLPTTLPRSAGQTGSLTRAQLLRRRTEDVLRDLGLSEIVGWSFTDPEEIARLRIASDDPRSRQAAISNPLSEDASVMRTTLLGSLLDAAALNVSRGAERLALFESGRVYLQGESTQSGDLAGDAPDPVAGRFVGRLAPPLLEPHHLGALVTGAVGRSWRGEDAGADFFSLKAVLEALAGQLGVPLSFEAGSDPFLHPGRSAAVIVSGETAGWIGELHPIVCRHWDIDAAVAFEVGLAVLLADADAGEEAYEDVTTYPPAHQDLAVVIDEGVAAEDVRRTILAAGGELLRDAAVFDLYRGEQVPQGRKSLAMRLEFRAADRTLTDEEVAGLRERIEAELESIGGSLRA